MKEVKIKRLFFIIFLPLCFGVLFIILNYVTSFSFHAQAQSSADNNVRKIVKIPPPLKGKELVNRQQPQKLEVVKARILTSSGKEYVFNLEMARTLAQKRKGLMFRNSVPRGSGMLFLFDDVKERAFWMKNTWVELDILFIRKDGIIHSIHHRAKPYSLDRILSNGKVAYVLEIGGGEVKRLGISIGDRLIYNDS